MTTENKISLPFFQEFPLIHCECGQAFVLVAVIKREEDFQERYDWMNQSSVYYCPYCGGKKHKNPCVYKRNKTGP